MANQDTQRHSKTFGNYPKSNLSTLASTLIVSGCSDLDLCRATAQISVFSDQCNSTHQKQTSDDPRRVQWMRLHSEPAEVVDEQ
jgi:hypothetical protein